MAFWTPGSPPVGPTVLVTGLTPEALAERYNPQLTSRLEGEFTSVQFYGRDQRRKKED